MVTKASQMAGDQDGRHGCPERKAPGATPIPVSCVQRPTVGGLVVPYISPRRTDDGRPVFGAAVAQLVAHCIEQRRCGVCGGRLPDRFVVLVRDSDLAPAAAGALAAVLGIRQTRQPGGFSAEPALDPQCAAYTTTACPMVSGRMRHYRAGVRDYGPGVELAADQPQRQGRPADRWYAVWITDYQVQRGDDGAVRGLSWTAAEELRRRPAAAIARS